MFVEIESTEDLKEILRQIQNGTEKIFILGGGTNLLINDKGFDGLVIYNKIGGILRQNLGQVKTIRVGSGVLVKDLLDFCAENSMSGLEWAGGLPGTVGGAVRGNAGAFKGETKDSVVEVESLDIKTLEEKTRNNSECKFGYRNSIFKSKDGTDEFITKVVFRLENGDKVQIRKKIQEKIDYRNKRHPMDRPNIGSIFKNIPFDLFSESLRKELIPYVKIDPFYVIPTIKLIELVGLKGRRIGDAMISDKHASFIVNVGNATSEDVKALIEIIKKEIKTKYNIMLEEEIISVN